MVGDLSTGSRRRGEGHILDSLGVTLSRLGRYRSAIACLEAAIHASRQVGSRKSHADIPPNRGLRSLVGRLWWGRPAARRAVGVRRERVCVVWQPGTGCIMCPTVPVGTSRLEFRQDFLQREVLDQLAPASRTVPTVLTYSSTNRPCRLTNTDAILGKYEMNADRRTRELTIVGPFSLKALLDKSANRLLT